MYISNAELAKGDVIIYELNFYTVRAIVEEIIGLGYDSIRISSMKLASGDTKVG